MTIQAEQILEVLRCATEENQIDALRANQVIVLPDEGELWMTGDIHDHRRNFQRLIDAADLAHNPGRHLVLHELIHGDHVDASGAEESWIMLARAAELKCDYPAQVHFLLANHDLAQIYGEGIMKSGLSLCEAFNAGVNRDFPDQATAMIIAITEFLLSFPLAVRAPNGIFCCHSLPTNKEIETFDYTVFDRPLIGADYIRKTGPVYQLIWGRNISPTAAKNFAENVNADLLITGHQPQDAGYFINGEQHLILASDHNHGVFLPIDLSERYDMETAVNRLRKFVALDV